MNYGQLGNRLANLWINDPLGLGYRAGAHLTYPARHTPLSPIGTLDRKRTNDRHRCASTLNLFLRRDLKLLKHPHFSVGFKFFIFHLLSFIMNFRSLDFKSYPFVRSSTFAISTFATSSRLCLFTFFLDFPPIVKTFPCCLFIPLNFLLSTFSRFDLSYLTFTFQ